MSPNEIADFKTFPRSLRLCLEIVQFSPTNSISGFLHFSLVSIDRQLGRAEGEAGGAERSFFDGWTEEGTALWGIISRLRPSCRSGLQRCGRRAPGPADAWTLGASAPSSSEGGRVSKRRTGSLTDWLHQVGLSQGSGERLPLWRTGT